MRALGTALALIGRHWRIPVALALAATLAGVIAWVDHRTARRTEAQLRATQLMIENRMRADLRRSEARLAGTIAALAADYEQSRTVIERTRTIVQPIVTREIVREPRLSDPAAGLTPGLFDAINRARATGACAAAAAGGIRCPLPQPAPAREPDDRGTGPQGH